MTSKKSSSGENLSVVGKLKEKVPNGNNNRSTRATGTHFTGAADAATFELNEVDQHILKLNQQGHSIGKISKLLNELHNIHLSKSSISRHLRELMQDPDNNVQRNYKCYTQKPKEQQKWYNVVLELQRYFPEYQRTWGSKPSSRTASYDMQDKHLITSRDAETFTRVTVQARLGWLDYEGNLIYPKLSIDCFSDDKDHSVTAGFYGNDSPIEPTPPGSIPDWKEHIDYYIKMLKDAPLYYSGEGDPGRQGEIGGYWYGQTEIVEVWEEKVDLVGNFAELLDLNK